MAANVELIQTSRIVANGGEITSDRYINDGSADLAAGELCFLLNGTIVPVSTSAAQIDTDTTAFATAGKYFISLEDVDVSEDSGGYVKVQEVTADSVLEGYVVDSGVTGDVTMAVADIGEKYCGYVTAAGMFGVDNASQTKPVFVIEDVDDNYEPYRAEGDFEKDSSGVRHQRVRFKLLNALIA